MSTMPLPQQFSLPPIGVTVTEEGQIRVEWLPQALAAQPSAALPPAVMDQLAAAALRQDDEAAVLGQIEPVLRPAAQVVLREYRAHPLVRIAREQQRAAQEKLLKLESHARIDAQLARMHPARQQVQRVPALSEEAFFRDYYAANQPVVITGMMGHWPALSRWTPEHFRAGFGQVPVQVQMGRDGDPDYEVNMHQLRQTLPFADYIDKVEHSGPTNDFYLVASNHVLHETGLGGLLQDVNFFPEFMDAGRQQGSVFFWYGPQGTVTPLHHDPLNIILAQVRGRKKVVMYPPVQTPLLCNELGVYSRANPEDVAGSPPGFADATPLETVLAPGEALFIPVGWWHHVRSLDVAVSVSATGFKVDNHYHWNMPNHDTRSAKAPPAGVVNMRIY